MIFALNRTRLFRYLVIHYCGYYKQFISWAKGQKKTAKKLQGDCIFVNRYAEVMEINCATKLTIICEEL